MNAGSDAVSRETKGLLLFTLANVLLVNAVVALGLGTPWPDTSLGPLHWFMEGRQGGDSWRPMNEALDYVEHPPAEPKTLYRRMFFTDRVKHKGFQYPPTSLLPIWGARRVLGEAAQTGLEWLTWLAVPFTVFSCVAIAEYGRPRDRDAWLRIAALVILALTFYPTIRAYRNGQIQTWINLAFAAAVWAWLRGSPLATGALSGAVALIKPQYALLGAWGVARRRWGFVAGAAIVGGIGLLLSIALFGWAPHVEYLRVLRFIARRGETFYPNQSVNGLLNRWFENGDSVGWMEAFPPPHPWVYAGTMISSALLLALAFFGPMFRRNTGGVADLCLMGVTLTIASPIAWEHHHGVLLPAFAYLYSRLAREPILGRAGLPLLAAAYVPASHSFIATNALAGTPWGVLQSYRLFAAWLVAGLLLAVIRRHSRTTSTGPRGGDPVS